MNKERELEDSMDTVDAVGQRDNTAPPPADKYSLEIEGELQRFGICKWQRKWMV